MPRIRFERVGPKIPWGKLNQAAYQAAMHKQIKAFAELAVHEHKRTTQNWETEVNFVPQLLESPRSGLYEVDVFVTNRIWTFVDQGTRPHAIRPKKAGGMLVFPVGGKAKTQPGRIDSGTGATGTSIVFAKGVQHPGTKPRGFSEMIQKILAPRFAAMMEVVIERYTEELFKW